MAVPVSGYLGYDPLADRPLVKLKSGTKKLLTEDDGTGGGGGGPHKTTHQDGGSDEINVNGLSGVLANPQRANQLVLPSSASLLMGAVTDGQFLKRDGSMIVGAAAGGGSDITRYCFQLRAVNTGQSSSDEIGVLQFNAADFPSHTKTLVANLEVSRSGQLATLEMFNLTDGSTVTTVTSSSTITEKKTAIVTLPASDKLYGLRLFRTGGTANERVSCRSAALELRA